MKAYLRLKGKIRPRRKLSAVSDQPSALRLWQFIKYCALDKVRFLRIFLQSILVFVSCSAALAQESVVHTTPANQAEVTANKITEHDITPLKIGDKIPDELWEMYFPVVSAKSDQVQYLSLGDFKDKLILLDFWSTWCSTCIASIDKLAPISNRLSTDFFLLPVTGQERKLIQPFIEKRNWEFPTIIEDSFLRNIFPHKGVPYIIWILGGEVKAITNADYTTEENILKLLKGVDTGSFLSMVKNTINFNSAKPLFIDNKLQEPENILYQSIFTSYTQVLPKTLRVIAKQGIITMVNVSTIDLYQKAYSGDIDPVSIHQRLVFEIEEDKKHKIIPPPDLSSFQLAEWNQQNSFCYNLVLPHPQNTQETLNYMKNELNQFFGEYLGIQGSIQKRLLKCLVLRSSEGSMQLINRMITKNHKGNLNIIDEPFSRFVSSFRYANMSSSIPIIDRTTIKGNVNMAFNAPLYDLPAIKKELSDYGIFLEEEILDIDVLVISEKEKKL